MINDNLLTILFFFLFAVASILLVRYAKSKSKDNVITNSATSHQSSNKYSEFENSDIDRDIDEISDDCLIYDDLFDDEP